MDTNQNNANVKLDNMTRKAHEIKAPKPSVVSQRDNPMPLATVLMAVYMEPIDILKKSLDSIINQKYDDLEVLVVHDSPDQSDIREFLERYAQRTKRVQVIFNDENIGLAQSLNKAFRFASGDYLIRADADDVSKSDRVLTQITFLESNRHVDLVGSGMTVISDCGRFLGHSPPPKKTTLNALQYRVVSYHPTWAMRREVFTSLSGYRNFPCSQDYDFLFRALEQRFNVNNINKMLVYRRLGEKNMSTKNRCRQAKIAECIRRYHKQRRDGLPDTFDAEYVWRIFQVEKRNEWLPYMKHLEDFDVLVSLKRRGRLDLLLAYIPYALIRNPKLMVSRMGRWFCSLL